MAEGCLEVNDSLGLLCSCEASWGGIEVGGEPDSSLLRMGGPQFDVLCWERQLDEFGLLSVATLGSRHSQYDSRLSQRFGEVLAEDSFAMIHR